ncbi:MAG: uroporphyrinogen decarboxylase [Pseudonocardiaceae bacterium]
MSTLFLDAAWGASTPTAPVWLMRQAGRYLPEYRDLKQRYGFWTMVRHPDLAAEVTLHPVRRFPLDAAILFSDIMTPLPSMGVRVEFQPGPVISQPVRSQSDVDSLGVPEAEEIAPFVAEACRLLRAECPVPLIGFAGGPLTLLTYLVQGTGTSDHGELRGWLWRESATAHALLDKLTEVTIRYLRTQVLSGVQAVQLFDSWAGVLDEAGYASYGLPYAYRVLDALGGLGVPRIYLAVGASHLYPQIATLPAEVVSVDWRCSLARSRQQLPDKVLQGNLDPGLLLSTPELAVSAAATVLRSGMGGAHIFNLGHGVLPQTPPDTVARLVDAVHEFRRDVTEGGQEQ